MDSYGDLTYPDLPRRALSACMFNSLSTRALRQQDTASRRALISHSDFKFVASIAQPRKRRPFGGNPDRALMFKRH
jgi:hypothetical protein